MSKAEEATNDFCTRCFKYGKCHKVQSECTMADSYQEGYEDGYHQARRAVEIAREEIYEWLRVNLCNYFDAPRSMFEMCLDDLKQEMKDEEVR